MSRKTSLAGILSFPIFLAACAGLSRNTPSTLPPYMHKIAIRPFSNHTQQYGLEDKLTLAVQAEFNRDGRYQITTENQADGVVIGDITKYILEPMSYDANHVPTEYKLWILTSVSFLDKTKDEPLWKEPDMSGELRYFVASSGFAGAMSEDDARQVIWDELSRDIRTRALEGQSAKKENTKESAYESSTGTIHVDNGPPPMPDTKPASPAPPIPY